MRHLIIAFLFLTAAQTAAAEPAGLAPDGWSRSEQKSITVYKAPTGTEMMLFAEVPTTDTGPMAILQATAKSLATASGGRLDRSKMYFEDTMAVFEFEFANARTAMRGAAFGIEQPDGKTLGLIHIGEVGTRGFAARNAEAKTKMAALAAGTAPATDAPAPAEAEAAAPDTPSASDYSTGDLETVVFDIDYLGGVGGFTYPEYRPVYLFRDGSACKCGESAVEEVSLSEARAQHRSLVGQWRRAGGSYVIAYDDGSEETIDPEVSPPIPLPEDFALHGRYQAIGGGGNLAFGGNVLAAAVEDLAFFPDGSFGQSNFAGGATTNVTTWSKRGSAGTWNLDGPTLTLNYRDGRTVRTSLFYTARGATTGGMPDVLWIGGDSYTLED